MTPRSVSLWLLGGLFSLYVGGRVLAGGCPEPLFIPQAPISVVNVPTALAAADLNGDGHLDLAIADATSDISRDSIAIRLGNGSGSFGAAARYEVGDGVDSIVVADFNGDGKLDLATANSHDGSISILRGNAAGAFAAQLVVPAGNEPLSMVSGDFDEDGDVDLAVTNFFDATVSVLLGDGSGRFDQSVRFPVGNQPISLVAGDIDGDGHIDLAVARTYLDYDAAILIGDGRGEFHVKGTTPLLGYDVRSILLLDINADGRLDLIAVDALQRAVRVLVGLGNGAFSSPTDVAVGAQPIFVAAADLNADGRPDLAVTNYDSNSVSILLGPAVGGTWQRFDLPVQGPLGILAADVNGDRRSDLLISNFNSHQVSLLLNGCNANQPPDCGQASASRAELWPPNHELMPIGVAGVTDSDGDQVEVRISTVSQDEPAFGDNGVLGGDRHCPDATIDDGGLRLRSERLGWGNGRIYTVSFEADDGKGGSCRGTVQVCVPHQHGACVDDGPVFDSLATCELPADRSGSSRPARGAATPSTRSTP
jgi:VCBS repeat protein/FG-GAP repeat protein